MIFSKNKIIQTLLILFCILIIFFTNLINIKILISFYVFLLLPGYYIYSSTSLNKLIPNSIFNIPIYFTLSLALFMPLFTYLSFSETNWDKAILYFYINYAIYFLFFFINGRDLKFIKPKLKYWPYYLILVLVLAGNHYFDFYQDSVYHLYRIKYLTLSNVVTNQFATTFENAIESISKHDLNYMTQKNISWPTYDFSYYFALIVLLKKITLSTTYQFIFWLNKFLFLNLILASLSLANFILKKEKYLILLFLTLVLSHIILKNYYNVLKLGTPAYNFISLYHPTNIAIFIFSPIITFLFMKFRKVKYSRSKEFEKYFFFSLTLLTTFMIHKISFIILTSFFFGFELFEYLQIKKINYKGILYSITPILISIVYIVYYFYIPKIYNVVQGAITNSSLTESRARALVSYSSTFDFFNKYGSYLENTGYKLLFFPITFMAIILFIIIYDKNKLKTRTGMFISVATITFIIFLLPGMNYLVIKLMRAFIQRMFTILYAEIILAFILYTIMQKTKKDLIKPLTVVVTISLFLTVSFDLFRKGNQKFIYDTNRISYIDFINKNISNNKFIADFNSEHELNSEGKHLSIFFNYFQSAIHRANQDDFNFHERLNRFIYKGENETEFFKDLKIKDIHYIIVSKNNYLDNTFENFKTDTFDENFKEHFIKNNAKIVYEDKSHVIFKI